MTATTRRTPHEHVATTSDGLWICPCGHGTDGAGGTTLIPVIPGTTVQRADDAPFGEHMCERCGRIADMDHPQRWIIARRDPRQLTSLYSRDALTGQER